ncbi:TPA: 3-deoxy-manno-octulosonate cytidylyltransferase [Enterococcus faecium]|uniref:3-deoxy-manno-octulosonate cytidylyltransferase n=1 Tax=Enterococcus faecium TaxID=1352 RepID=UPI0002A1F741|nr:3-deoxy-manno-octulosonate cytidylyltransferase [Enterococcus faecium]ELA59268.1 3-deoxy-D-manno-octulosonate cytidylyltransferase [Enterococcus faecium EnGen0013]EOF93741.1 3-deoxy-D-manno-octulosonate cytidylyltransferase [Enterococcus faecium EnGen0166]MDV7710310.1 3-deoxy-manno-octulosonate cytidylyltransferase [Enterococcus faecium]MDW3723008.1 3-deoxy-manno-octulosonate cytidylyltransferase [Enterococcus faecium]HAQ7384500.1 3-deoxy-manno-octulosonate cytidylyltransferase [Enterococcu
MKVVGIIPSRYGSTRMPGKPLMDICGYPMIWWVYQNVKKVTEFDEIYVATDDERIKAVCEEFGASVIMTTSDCSCLIDRVYQVSQVVDADYYVTVNGDEPILESEIMPKIIPDFVERDKPIVRGLVREFKDPVEVIDPGNIKIVVGLNGYSLYTSRSPVPYPQKTAKFTYKKYVGVELFNRSALDFYVNNEQTEIEKIEDIGSIRFLEHGIRIHYDLVESESLSVDTPLDLEKIRDVIAKRIENA